MNRTVELPEPVYDALEEAARVSGTTAANWIAARLPQPADRANGRDSDDWLDRDFLKHYAHDVGAVPDLDTVRRAMAKIPGRLADDIRAERDER